MEKVKLSFFDTFAYLIPGTLITTSIVILMNPEIKILLDVPQVLKDISTPQILFALLSSYILGIVCNHFGHQLYQLAKMIWKKEVIHQKDYSLSDTEIHVLIRELSPNNYAYLESWLGLSNMSHNLALALLMLMTISIIKIFQLNFIGFTDWLMLTILCMISTIIFLKRSIRFNNYYKTDRVATIERLHLVERAKLSYKHLIQSNTTEENCSELSAADNAS
jgi:hypothetical protein